MKPGKPVRPDTRLTAAGKHTPSVEGLPQRGDLYVGDGRGGTARLPVGQVDYILTVDPTVPFGVSWNIAAASKANSNEPYVTFDADSGALTNNRVLTAGTGITITDAGVDDGAITIATTITQYTDEMAQDAVGTIFVDSTEINFTYADGTPSITATLIDGSIALARLANLATQRVIGRNTAGTGVPEAVTATQIIDWIGSTRGSILYRGAAGWAILAPGTSGHFLKSNGAGADPSYAAAGGGTPAGSTTEVQFNDGGAFGAEAEFTYDKTDFLLSVQRLSLEPNDPGTLATGDVVGELIWGEAFYSGSVIRLYMTYGTVENMFWGIGAGNASHAGAVANLGIGRGALANLAGSGVGNIAIGDSTGATIDNEEDNVVIGSNADIGVSGINDAVALGSGSVATQSNAFAIGARVIEIDGAGDSCGLATLVGGTVTVSTGKVTANSLIFLTRQTTGGTVGHLRISARSAATSFTITSSSGTETSTIAWLIIEPT